MEYTYEILRKSGKTQVVSKRVWDRWPSGSKRLLLKEHDDCPVCENRRELKRLAEGMEPYSPQSS